MMQNTITIIVHATNFPGRNFGDCTDLQVGWGMGKQVLDAVAADVVSATFTAQVEPFARKDGTVDYRGPLVQGKIGARFLYLTWTSATAPQTPIRRIKLNLPIGSWEELRPSPWVAHIQMTGRDGCPVAASLKPPYLRWE